MATLSFPSFLVPNQVSWHLEPNTGAFMSPLSRAVQTVELPGARWVCEMTLPPLVATYWRQYSAWLAKMRGQAGRVYVVPPHYRGSNATSWTPDETALTCDSSLVTCDSSVELVDQTSESPWGTPVVDRAGQSGNTLHTRGWVASVTVLKAGDYLSYDTTRGRTLHMVVDDAVSDGAGDCDITIEPPIRTAPADGAAIEIDSPSCIMTLSGSMAGAMNIGLGLKASVQLSLVEVF